jgi:2-polyprenyl-6-methoxyphenol hydroxylase-like FAD-dependent oxidoreductase
VSLFGDGSTLAMAGAYTLATELAADPEGAFARYESAHRELVDPRQANVAAAAAMMVPASRPGITARNLASRLWPAAAAAGWVRTRLTTGTA